MKLVLVEWEDSFGSFAGWHTVDFQTDYISSCVSVGIVIQEDKKQITLVQSRSESENSLGTISIPRGCIKRIRYLKVK